MSSFTTVGGGNLPGRETDEERRRRIEMAMMQRNRAVAPAERPATMMSRAGGAAAGMTAGGGAAAGAIRPAALQAAEGTRGLSTYNPDAALSRVRQNASPTSARPNPEDRSLDPVEVRNRQNRLLAQQRAVDMQIRQLRRQRAQGRDLSPEQTGQLASLEQQAVELRQGKVDAFRLANELEGRGPLSPTEAEASRQRLANQIPDARRAVLGQAEGELDQRFESQLDRQMSGGTNYLPEGTPDRREMQLREEMAGPNPGEARQQFLADTAGGGMPPEQRASREQRMDRVRQAEIERQVRARRDAEVRGMEQDAALDSRETRAQIDGIAAETDVQRARNAATAAEVENRGITLAGMQIDQEARSIADLGDTQIAASRAQLEQQIAEAESAAFMARNASSPEAIAQQRRLQELEGELMAVQLEQAVREFGQGPEVAGEARSMVVDGIAQSFTAINGKPITGNRVAQLGALASAVDQLKRLPNENQRQEMAQEALRQIRIMTGDTGVRDSGAVSSEFVRNFFRSLSRMDVVSAVSEPGSSREERRRREEQSKLFRELTEIAGVSLQSEDQ